MSEFPQQYEYKRLEAATQSIIAELEENLERGQNLRFSVATSALIRLPTYPGEGSLVVKSTKANRYSPVGGHVRCTNYGRIMLEEGFDARFPNEEERDLDFTIKYDPAMVDSAIMFLLTQGSDVQETDCTREIKEELQIGNNEYNALYLPGKLKQRYLGTYPKLKASSSKDHRGRLTLYLLRVFDVQFPDYATDHLYWFGTQTKDGLIVPREYLQLPRIHPDLLVKSKDKKEPPLLEGDILAQGWNTLEQPTLFPAAQADQRKPINLEAICDQPKIQEPIWDEDSHQGTLLNDSHPEMSIRDFE